MTVIVACATGLFFLLLVISILLICRKRRQKRRKVDFLLEDSKEKIVTYNSEPMLSSTSPKLAKRKYYQDAYGSVRGVRSSSAALEKIRDTTDSFKAKTIIQKSFSIPSMQNQSSSLGTLRPEIYSTTDTEDGNLQESQNGRIWFSILYDATMEQLTVNLIKIKELHERKNDKSSRDPFVKIFLLPDERTYWTSKVVKKTLSPVFNQTICFQVPPLEIASRSIRFSVYDVDKRRVRHSLGHVFVPLKDFDMTRGNICWRDLEQTIQSSAPLGEIYIGLTYLPNVDQIKIFVLSARDLRETDLESEKGYYVKLNFRYGRKIIKSKKTIIRRTHGPEITFNESFTFNFSGKQVNSCNFVISLRKASRSGQDSGGEYGFVSFGSFMFARGEDLLHWQDMLAQPRMTIRKWHRLSFSPGKR
ncbi:hypothetical protein CHS0354_019046 [Potamilus streckersoni]|uniref:C2 domain-containing protein n=1 Tax=Potamilus streckersoni TaxID=2493646 RepID=A0AAE0VWM1_9BIVA|nr:hypothetical protein CHS0354_019046 [Potamilus streckersoni]